MSRTKSAIRIDLHLEGDLAQAVLEAASKPGAGSRSDVIRIALKAYFYPDNGYPDSPILAETSYPDNEPTRYPDNESYPDNDPAAYPDNPSEAPKTESEDISDEEAAALWN